MDDGGSVEVVEVSNDSRFEFSLGCDADVAEHGAGHLGEKALDEIKPRAVLGREHEAEPALALTFDPSLGFFRDMSRVVVEDYLDYSIG